MIYFLDIQSDQLSPETQSASFPSDDAAAFCAAFEKAGLVAVTYFGGREGLSLLSLTLIADRIERLSIRRFSAGEGAADLRMFKSLRSLALHEVSADGFDGLAWPKLDVVSIDFSSKNVQNLDRCPARDVRGIFSKKKKLAALSDLRLPSRVETLELHDLHVASFDGIEALPNLREALFAGCAATDFAALARCSSLRKLSLIRCKNPPVLPAMPWLESLQVTARP